MNTKPIQTAERDVAAAMINSFAGLVHARLRGWSSKVLMYERELKEFGVHVTFSNENGGDHE
ncbi:hypothetical protein Pan153_59540 [Gimesia panareensis]|uniref:Uncharacterized protein n=1 Tax=Gimesia panareensis TaxID=2527978 RepID=A0A518FYA5_9PLAN|nr:hypothetical protein Pan153_59540 [Gimesia panareensis]